MNTKTVIKTCKIAKILSALVLTCGLFFSSCKKGDTGPAGANGTNGNANVVSSSLTTNLWTYVSPSWELTLSYPAITQNILDKGAVLVYMQFGTNYYPLPYTYYPSSTFSSTFTYVHYLGGLKVFVTDSDLTQPSNPGTLTFKVVVIAASQRIAHPHVNYNDYNEVKTAFNLKD